MEQNDHPNSKQCTCKNCQLKNALYSEIGGKCLVSAISSMILMSKKKEIRRQLFEYYFMLEDTHDNDTVVDSIIQYIREQNIEDRRSYYHLGNRFMDYQTPEHMKEFVRLYIYYSSKNKRY